MQQDPLKSGLKTSEFLGVIVSLVISTAVLFGLLPAEQAQHFSDQLLQFANLCVQLVTIVGAMAVAIRPLVKYIESRTQLKTAHINKDATTPPTTV